MIQHSYENSTALEQLNLSQRGYENSTAVWLPQSQASFQLL